MEQIVRPAVWPKNIIESKYDTNGFLFLFAYRPRANKKYAVISYDLEFEARFDSFNEACDYYEASIL